MEVTTSFQLKSYSLLLWAFEVRMKWDWMLFIRHTQILFSLSPTTSPTLLHLLLASFPPSKAFLPPASCNVYSSFPHLLHPSLTPNPLPFPGLEYRILHFSFNSLRSKSGPGPSVKKCQKLKLMPIHPPHPP